MKHQRPVDVERKNWDHVAPGIGCRLDYKGAYVYLTRKGWIMAYNQRHAEERVIQLEEEEKRNCKVENQISEFQTEIWR